MSSRNKLIFLVIISILLSSLSLIAISESSSNENIINIVSNDSIFSEKVDHNIVKIDSSQDLDENSFQDSFERTLRESSPSNSFEAIVSFSKPTSSVELSFLEMWDIDVLSEYSVIHSFHIKGSAHSILQLNQLQNTIFIEENSVGEALLFSSIQQSGVRKVWQDSLGYGYTGDSSTAIAILDTGVDDSHSDSNFNIVYWQDFAGVDYGTPGDEYITPSDKAEHGTHCASIAASQGAVINDGIFKIQDSGFLPTTDGNAWFGSWFYVDGPQTVTLNYAWESGGTAYVGIYNETQWILDNYASASGSSPATFQVSLPRAGWYCPMWGNKASAGNNYYSGELVYDSGWTNPYSDGRGAFAGVAPDSNIVALKVLDDMGFGSVAGLLDGIQWLYDNGQDYGVTVASMSVGWGSVVSAIDSAITSLVRNKGIVCVVAAGNGGTASGGIFSPASSPDCITVGAVNKASEITYYSSIGSVSDSYMRPDVVAPGGSFASSGSSAAAQPIFAADSSDGDEAYNDNTDVKHSPGTDYFVNNFRGLQGTSMACPFVAGIAQLVVDAMMQAGTWEYSWNTAKKIKQIICMGTSEVGNIEGSISTGGETFDGDGDATPQIPTVDRTEKDYTEGWGLVSAEAAIQAVTEFFNGMEVFSLSGRVNGSHVAVRQVDLISGEIYYLRGEYVIDFFVDADVLLFDKDPDQYGDPVLIANCSLGVVTNDSTIFAVPEDGYYYLVVKWVDGNYTGQCNVTLSTVVGAEDPPVGSIRNGGTEIDLLVFSNNVVSISYYWDSSVPMPLTSSTVVNLPSGDGIHDLIINAQDYFGKVAQATFRYITDDTNPVIELIGLTNNSVVPAGEYFQLNIIETNLDSVYYSWDGDMFSLIETPYNISVLDETGAHYVGVKARDKAGNERLVRFDFDVTKSTSKSGDPLLPIALTLITIFGLAIINKKRK